MNKTQELTELEMFELLQLAYPGKFQGESDEVWEEAMKFADNLCGFSDIADLLGRVVMMTNPMVSPLTKKVQHVFGDVVVKGGSVYMVAVVKRDAQVD